MDQIGIKHEIISSNFQEDLNSKSDKKQLAKHLAFGKAQDVANRITDGIVIGADTFVVFKNKILGKPKDKAEAKKTLKTLSGKTVEVYTGIALIDIKNKKKIIDCSVAEIKIKKLSEKEIDGYVKTGEPLDKAGAFAVQGRGAVFIEKINGCYTGIVGLPLNKLYKNLQKLGANI